MTYELAKLAGHLRNYAIWMRTDGWKCRAAHIDEAADVLDRLSTPAPLPEEIEDIRERHAKDKIDLAVDMPGALDGAVGAMFKDRATLLRALGAKTQECEKMREVLTMAKDELVRISEGKDWGAIEEYIDAIDAALATKGE